MSKKVVSGGKEEVVVISGGGEIVGKKIVSHPVVEHHPQCKCGVCAARGKK